MSDAALLSPERAYLRGLRRWLATPAVEQCESLALLLGHGGPAPVPGPRQMDVVWRQFSDGTLVLHLMPRHGHPLRDAVAQDGDEVMWRRTTLLRDPGPPGGGFQPPSADDLRAVREGRVDEATRRVQRRHDRLLAAVAWAVDRKLDEVEGLIELHHRAQLRLVRSARAYLEVLDCFDLRLPDDPPSGTDTLQSLARMTGLGECFVVTTAARFADDDELVLAHLRDMRVAPDDRDEAVLRRAVLSYLDEARAAQRR